MPITSGRRRGGVVRCIAQFVFASVGRAPSTAEYHIWIRRFEKLLTAAVSSPCEGEDEGEGPLTALRAIQDSAPSDRTYRRSLSDCSRMVMPSSISSGEAVSGARILIT